LAAKLGLARGVVVEAYAQLVAEGYLTSRSGGVHAGGVRAGRRADARRTQAWAAGPVALASPVADFGYARQTELTDPASALTARGNHGYAWRCWFWERLVSAYRSG